MRRVPQDPGTFTPRRLADLTGGPATRRTPTDEEVSNERL